MEILHCGYEQVLKCCGTVLPIVCAALKSLLSSQVKKETLLSGYRQRICLLSVSCYRTSSKQC